MEILQNVTVNVEHFMEAYKESHGHGCDHFFAVEKHSEKATKCEELSERITLQVRLASLLHDVDDHKIFKDSKDFQNARMLLDISIDQIENKQEFIEGVIDMIKLVSCSSNGSSDTEKKYMLIPRDCDRLEGIGHVGIERCLDYNKHKGHPLHLDSTIRAYTREEVIAAANPERFVKYSQGVPSLSVIDHFYDKLLHIGKSENLKSQYRYILEEANKRTEVMIDFVLNYWKENK